MSRKFYLASALLFAALTSLSAADDKDAPKKGAEKKETLKSFVKKLQGNWKMDSAEFGGNNDTGADRKGALVEGTVWTLIIDGKAQASAKLVIDVKKEPATVDVKWTKGASGPDLARDHSDQG